MNSYQPPQSVTSGGGPNRATASWVIRETSSKRVICETFNVRAVERLNTMKYEAVPIHDYLVEVNAAARKQQ